MENFLYEDEKRGLYFKGSFFSPHRFLLNSIGFSFLVVVPILYFFIYRFLSFQHKRINGKIFILLPIISWQNGIRLCT